MQTMLDEMQCGIKEYNWPDRWYMGKKRRFLKAPEQASDTASANPYTQRQR